MAQSHDAIPFDRVAELIGEAESFRQSVVLHDAWREYAAKAVRPYAWKTFAQYARAHFNETGDWSPERGKEKLTPWQDGARASRSRSRRLCGFACPRRRPRNRAWAA